MSSGARAGDARPVAVVTGAATGIGHAVSQMLVARGWVVVGTRLPGQRAESRGGHRHEDLELDLTDPGAPSLIAEASASMGGARLFVSSAGISLPGPIELRADELEREFAVNAAAPARLAAALLPQLRQHSGRIVLIGAGQGRVALPFGGGYAASKAGLAAIADALRAEVDGDGVEVSLIEPGAVRTGILASSRVAAQSLMARAPADQRRRYEARLNRVMDVAARRFASAPAPSQIAELIVRVATTRVPRTRYVVGGEARFLRLLSHVPAGWRAKIVSRLGNLGGQNGERQY